MTGVPGLPARAVWAKGERGHKAAHGSGGYAAEWNDCPDGKFEWKGDTSSDEIASHFYAVGVFLELAAEGPEREQGSRHLAHLADHLIRNGWKLVDRDGRPTRWGHWDPEYFRTEEGRFDRGLQALEALSFMKTAWHFTREPRFQQAYQQLVELGYPDYTLRQRSIDQDRRLARRQPRQLREAYPPLQEVTLAHRAQLARVAVGQKHDRRGQRAQHLGHRALARPAFHHLHHLGPVRAA